MKILPQEATIQNRSRSIFLSLTSDHLYYMCTKWFADGDVHKYFSPYDTPYDAFIAFMNALQDLEQTLPLGRNERPAYAEWPALVEMACVA